MSTKRLWFFWLVFLGWFCSTIFAGCSLTGGVPQWSGSGFIRQEVLEYKKVAVLPFKGDAKGEAPDTFAKSFYEEFPQIETVGRERVLGSFQERDLYSDRIEEATRRKVGKVFRVQALILGDVYCPSIFHWLLQIQVVEVKTVEVIGRSFVEIDYMEAEGVKGACKIAVKNLTPK